MTYLAIPIAGSNIDKAAALMDSARSAGAEMLELRCDYLTDLNVENLKELLAYAKKMSLPVIVTCRDRSEGGKGDWPLSLRTEILVEAVNYGADFIDCEYANFLIADTREKIKEALSKSQTRLILSAHNFNGSFENLSEIYDNILTAYEGAVPKLVYTAGHINDCFEAFDLLRSRSGDAIVFCMGAAGLMSRILAKKLGSLVTFGSVDTDSATAPGQITAGQLKNLYRWEHIDAGTRLFGVIANPVGHSLSPAIFNACFDEQNANALYLPLLVEGENKEFRCFLDNIERRPWLDFGGFSVTIPHKAHALDYAARTGEFLEPLASDIGAVNTLKVGLNSRISGFNTDYAGAMDALVCEMKIGRHNLHSVSVAVVGAGGVARAVAAGLADVGAKVTICNRTVAKACDLAHEFGFKYGSLDDLADMDATVIINCTSIGMHPNVDDSPVPLGCIKPDMVVFDTVYNPVETLLLKNASQVGAKTITGVEMFVRQAMAQYKIFTGTEGDEDVMRKTIFNCLSG